MKEKRSKKYSRFNYGWRPDLPDNRDLLFSAPLGILKALPPKVDLRPGSPGVVDQGGLGSCTANAIGTAHYFAQKKQASSKAFQPSRLFIYYNEREMIGTVDWDSGAYNRDGFKSIGKQGVCPESRWKYKISDFREKPTKACYEDALEHQAVEYRRVSQRLSQMKGCLADGFPFVFGFSVYESFETEKVWSSGDVQFPDDGESVLGGHAVLAVGYDNASQRFLFQNSYGKSWGDEGYGTIPYSFLTDPGLSSDFWMVSLVEIAHDHGAEGGGGLMGSMDARRGGGHNRPAATERISRRQTLRKTKLMLVREWNLSSEPTSGKNLRNAPPGGLGKNSNQLRALETPIEGRDFAGVGARVVGSDLVGARTVSGLRDVIWDGIPAENKI